MKKEYPMPESTQADLHAQWLKEAEQQLPKG
jgi:hypothetical protein